MPITVARLYSTCNVLVCISLHIYIAPARYTVVLVYIFFDALSESSLVDSDRYKYVFGTSLYDDAGHYMHYNLGRNVIQTILPGSDIHSILIFQQLLE